MGARARPARARLLRSHSAPPARRWGTILDELDDRDVGAGLQLRSRDVCRVLPRERVEDEELRPAATGALERVLDEGCSGEVAALVPGVVPEVVRVQLAVIGGAHGRVGGV